MFEIFINWLFWITSSHKILTRISTHETFLNRRRLIVSGKAISNLTELLPLVAIIVAFKNDELVGEKREKQFY